MNGIVQLDRALHLALVLACVFVATNSHAATAAYPEFVDKLHAYHVARSEFDAKFLMAIQRLGDTFSGSSDPEKIKGAAEDAAKAFDTAKKALMIVSGFAKKNAAALSASATVIQQLNSARAEIESGRIADAVTALKAFSDGVKRAELTVYGADGWSNSEIAVNSDDVIFVRTSGSWSCSPSMPTDGRGYICNADSPYRVSQAAPLCALIYRIRGSHDPNGRGLSDKGRGVSDAKGRLEFMINDSDRRNNNGQLDLKVVVFDGAATKKFVEVLRNGSQVE